MVSTGDHAVRVAGAANVQECWLHESRRRSRPVRAVPGGRRIVKGIDTCAGKAESGGRAGDGQVLGKYARSYRWLHVRQADCLRGRPVGAVPGQRLALRRDSDAETGAGAREVVDRVGRGWLNIRGGIHVGTRRPRILPERVRVAGVADSDARVPAWAGDGVS